jgi:hypothetical protein
MTDCHRHLPLITVSELKSFRACKRQHHYSYRLGYRSIDKAGPLRFGSAVHKALEVWWSAETLCDLVAAIEAIDSNGEIDPFERAKARAMMMNYHARWANEDYEVLAVEKQFEAPLINPSTGKASTTFRIGGQIDGIVRKCNGDVFLMERKTAGVEVGFDTPYWKRLILDTQISTYYVGGRALGYDIKGCIYDVLRKPAIRQKEVPILDADGMKMVVDSQGNRVKTKDGKKWRETASTADGYVLTTRPETPDEFEKRCIEVIMDEPDRYLVRGEVFRLESDELDAAQDMWDTARELRESELATRWPRNPDACDKWGRFCSYWEVCTGAATIEDETLYRRTKSKHEELSK